MPKVQRFWIAAGSLFLLASGWFFSGSDVPKSAVPKINGVSWVAPPQPVSDTAMTQLHTINANWVCLMPFAFASPSVPELHYSYDRQWWGERPDGILSCIAMAKKAGFNVLLKPQVWLKKGAYTGHFSLQTEAEWQQWEADYQNYIVNFAHMADSTGVEMLCIGTEWHTFFKERPQFWKKLIEQVRACYKGQLTYAANWDAYPEFPHWALLDYVGIDAYFPLSTEKTPSPDSLRHHWQRWKEQMKAVSEQSGKPVLFTEYGYRSIDSPTAKPWESYTEVAYNGDAQAAALEGFYQNLWNEPWVAGGFLWKWFPVKHPRMGAENTRFTPQGKPAEKVVAQWYKNLPTN